MRCMGKNEPKSGAGFSLQMWLVRFLGKKKVVGRRKMGFVTKLRCYAVS